MANTIKIKNSGTAANSPSAASLEYGELALNYADGKLYFKTGTSTVDFFATADGGAITLGTDTTGNYVSDVAAGTGISVSHTPSEGSTATVSVDATYNRLVPSGSIIAWGGLSSSPPSGFLTCDGTAVSRTTYSALYALIGDRYGAGDGSTTFNLPNFSSGLLPFSTTSLNASPGTGTRQTKTISSTNTASTGHSHTLNNTQSSGHGHTLNGTSVTQNSGGANSNHTHGVSMNSGGVNANHSHGISMNTGNVNADHSHSGNTGNISADHSHTYFKPNSGGNANTAGANSNHTHGFTTGGINANHSHLVSGNTGNHSADHGHLVSGNTGNYSADHGHAISHTHTAATIASTNADTGHLHTIASTNSDTEHLHTLTGTYVVYIIKI